MTDISDINLWAAEKCGIKILPKTGYIDTLEKLPNLDFNDKWTIEDPRCREKLRKTLGIHTMQLDNDQWYSWDRTIGSTKPYDEIDEAEIAPITAIYEAEQE